MGGGGGWGGRGAGEELGKAEGTHLKGKRGAKEPGRWSRGEGEEEDVRKPGKRTEV